MSAKACKKLVCIGTDGAASNIAASGLKGVVERRLGWVFWMWCLAHRLELVVKDTLRVHASIRLMRCVSDCSTCTRNLPKSVERLRK